MLPLVSRWLERAQTQSIHYIWFVRYLLAAANQTRAALRCRSSNWDGKNIYIISVRVANKAIFLVHCAILFERRRVGVCLRCPPRDAKMDTQIPIFRATKGNNTYIHTYNPIDKYMCFSFVSHGILTQSAWKITNENSARSSSFINTECPRWVDVGGCKFRIVRTTCDLRMDVV